MTGYNTLFLYFCVTTPDLTALPLGGTGIGSLGGAGGLVTMLAPSVGPCAIRDVKYGSVLKVAVVA